MPKCMMFQCGAVISKNRKWCQKHNHWNNHSAVVTQKQEPKEQKKMDYMKHSATIRAAVASIVGRLDMLDDVDKTLRDKPWFKESGLEIPDLSGLEKAMVHAANDPAINVNLSLVAAGETKVRYEPPARPGHLFQKGNIPLNKLNCPDTSRLGTVPDSALAKEWGVSMYTVRRWRRDMKITSAKLSGKLSGKLSVNPEETKTDVIRRKKTKHPLNVKVFKSVVNVLDGATVPMGVEDILAKAHGLRGRASTQKCVTRALRELRDLGVVSRTSDGTWLMASAAK